MINQHKDIGILHEYNNVYGRMADCIVMLGYSEVNSSKQ